VARRTARTGDAHEELPEAVSEPLDVSEHTHAGMVRRAREGVHAVQVRTRDWISSAPYERCPKCDYSEQWPRRAGARAPSHRHPQRRVLLSEVLHANAHVVRGHNPRFYRVAAGE
jgi:hypothetical protein